MEKRRTEKRGLRILSVALLSIVISSCVVNQEPDSDKPANQEKTTTRQSATKENLPETKKPAHSHELHPRDRHEQEAQNLCKEARKALASGNVDKALELVDEAEKLTPRFPTVWYTRGVLARKKGNVKEAEQFLQKASHLNENYLLPWYELGSLYLAQNELLKSEFAYEKCKSIDPEYVPAYIGLAKVMIEQKKGKAARKYLQRALEKEPHNGVAWYWLGYDYHCMSKIEEAKKAYWKAVEYLDNAYAPYYLLAEIASRENNDADERRVLKAMITNFPDKIFAFEEMAAKAIDAGKWSEAFQYCHKFAELNPDKAIGQVLEAQVFMEKNQFDRAESKLEAVLKKWPDSVDALLALAICARQKNNLKKALEINQKAVKINPDDDTVWNHLAVTQLGLEDLKAARTSLEKSLKIASDNQWSFLRYARLLADMSEKKKAREYLDRAEKMDPQSSDLLLTRARFELPDNPKKARELATHVLKGAPDLAEGWYIRGLALIEEGDLTRAESSLEKAVKYSLHYKDAWEAIAKVKEKKGDKRGRKTALMMARKAMNKSPLGIYQEAYAMEKMGRHSDAGLMLKAGLALDPEEADVLLNLPVPVPESPTKEQ